MQDFPTPHNLQSTGLSDDDELEEEVKVMALHTPANIKFKFAYQ